jgi:hypothetical protein
MIGLLFGAAQRGGAARASEWLVRSETVSFWFPLWTFVELCVVAVVAVVAVVVAAVAVVAAAVVAAAVVVAAVAVGTEAVATVDNLWPDEDDGFEYWMYIVTKWNEMKRTT